MYLVSEDTSEDEDDLYVPLPEDEYTTFPDGILPENNLLVSLAENDNLFVPTQEEEEITESFEQLGVREERSELEETQGSTTETSEDPRLHRGIRTLATSENTLRGIGRGSILARRDSPMHRGIGRGLYRGLRELEFLSN